MANEAVFSALLPKGGTALAHGVGGGGHISHGHMGALGKRAAKIDELPRLADGYQLDAAAASAQIRAEKPQLIVLGRSLFLFPEDIGGIREACDEVGTTVLYDGSHVLGLISGGQFQDPLSEGADLMTASTHKTYYGPQRGIVVARGKDKDWWKPIDRAVFPGVTSNHHLFSLPAMYAASLEIQEFGAEYAKAVVRNAQAFAAALHKRGFAVAAPDLGYTKSHQVAVDMSAHGGGRDVARKLCEHGIVTNKNLLPGDPGNSVVNPGGIRTGVQEMTRFGMGEAEMDRIAELIHECVVGGKDVTAECKQLREAFPEVKFGYGVGQLS
jgi:glycine hydroxymethyltransferase